MIASFLFFVLVACWCCCDPACSDVVYLRDQPPVFGRVVSEHPEHVVFRQRLAGDTAYRERILPREEILYIVLTVDPSVLGQLDPAEPASYRELAEELAVQRRDPEARDLALRLYLLAARYGDRQLQQSCFRAMLPLARSPAEEMSLRALAWQTLGDELRWLESAPSRAELSPPAADAEQLVRLRETLRQLRLGDRAEAAREIDKPWFGEAIRQYSSICSWQDLRVWSAERELKTEWLARILELEIAIGRSAADSRADEMKNWSELIHRRHPHRGPVTFDNVTEFDLSNSIYRDGKWVKPEK